MNSFKDFLVEKVYNIDHEVDWIYKKLFGKFMDDIENRNKYSNLKDKTIDGETFMKIVKSNDIKTAFKNVPLSHIKYVTHGDDIYTKDKDGNGVIEYNISQNLINAHREKGNNKRFIDDKRYGMKTGNYLDQGLTVGYLKGVIRHELTHWISDGINNNHISTMFSRAKKGNSLKVFNKGKDRTHQFMTDYELNAQIAAIIEYRRNDIDSYNLWTFDELLEELPMMMAITRTLSKSEMVEWRKYILKRLARENLLGDEMH